MVHFGLTIVNIRMIKKIDRVNRINLIGNLKVAPPLSQGNMKESYK